MKPRRLNLFAIVPVLGLSLGACSQEAADEPGAAGGDTVVHTAEVAAAGKDDLVARGKEVYLANCAACHQPGGEGLAGAFPPLKDSDFLQGDRKAVLSAAMFGLSGPITVNGVEYNGVMPSLGHLPDEDLAAALTYVFATFASDAPAVSVEEVAALRAELGQDDRAAGERHQGATEGELSYQGAPSAISAGDTRPDHGGRRTGTLRGRIRHGDAAVFRALCRLSRRTSKGRDG